MQRARQSPPPEFRVIRDTPVIAGEAALARGRGFKVLALCLVMASALLWLLLWRLAWLVSEAAADPDRQQDGPVKLLLRSLVGLLLSARLG